MVCAHASRPAPPVWDGRDPVEFLLHLEAIDAAPKKGLSELPEDGWFGGAENARTPALCPLGIEARNVQRRKDAESGELTYVRDVFPMLEPKWGKTEPGCLTGGGTVSLPLAALSRAANIAWFASRQIVMELRLKLPAQASADVGGEWPEGVIAAEDSGRVRILFSSDLEPGNVLRHMNDLQGRLTAMPSGTVLELCAAPLEYIPGVPEVAGWLWLRGVISSGNWTIARALPAASQAALEGALALAAEVEQGNTIAVRDDAQGKNIIAWAKQIYSAHIKDNPPTLGKNVITFKKPGFEVELVGMSAFRARFTDTWPVKDLSGDEDDDEDEDEDDDGMFPATPIKGALIYTGAHGRAFHQTMALLLSMKIDAGVKAREKGLREAGFKVVGDIMTPAFEDLAFHGYGRADGTAFVWFRVSYPDEIAFEVISLFGNGAVLITSQDPNTRDDVAANVYRQGYARQSSAELIAQHNRSLAELAAKIGPPQVIAASQLGFANAIEQFLLKS